MLRAVGSDTFGPKVQSAPWFAAGALARVEWSATHDVSLELEGGAVVPAYRDRYVFLPGVVAHEIPAVAVVASAGVGVWF